MYLAERIQAKMHRNQHKSGDRLSYKKRRRGQIDFELLGQHYTGLN